MYQIKDELILFCWYYQEKSKFYFYDEREARLKKLKKPWFTTVAWLTTVACGQGLQVMLCMSNELLCDDLYFFT